ncbi:MAG: hypothetical protein GTO54_03360 [Nitrososphaeria archaeon]|nr:hypothetical protein [Nitrososphaeria archaeon]
MTDNKNLVERFFKVFNKRDWDALPELLTSDCVHGSDFSSFQREDIVSHYKSFIANGADSKWHLDRMTGEGDVVVVEFRWSSNHVIEMLGIPPTGKKFELPVVFVIDFEDGKIKRIRSLYSYELYQQILSQ